MYTDISKLKFQIFGSASSKDVDVMVFIDELKSTDENHSLVKLLNVYLFEIFKDSTLGFKEVNANLGVLKDGMLIDVFKGTYDECNNSLYETYNLHQQFYENAIQTKYDRKQNEYYHWKLKRVLRFILSFYSRVPELRTDIKSALRGDFRERIRVCRMIDLTKNTEFPKKKESTEDIYKVIAFQLVQIIMLSEQIEIYTKEEAVIMIPKLKPFLFRETFTTNDLEWLQFYYKKLIDISCNEISSMENLIEEF